ncbi:hypothetical protein DJ93_3282 [Bacillus clarus]|uniref:Uncharacterized protein n=1 Tax=Bacillus clarus TaxID=2338372 RepID=A0A090Z3B7_9BACI|nr:hypothetical protein DJ93_3282 [Bacillus clarus]
MSPTKPGNRPIMGTVLILTTRIVLKDKSNVIRRLFYEKTSFIFTPSPLFLYLGGIFL